VFHEAKLDQDLVKELITLNKGLPFQVVSGKTVCTDDFYEGKIRNKLVYLFTNFNDLYILFNGLGYSE